MDDILDDEWNSFLSKQDTNQYDFTSLNTNYNNNSGIDNDSCSTDVTNEVPNGLSSKVVPECEDLYISTTTKVLFLNQPIDIQNIYWQIPIIDYWNPVEGVLKKQIKIDIIFNFAAQAGVRYAVKNPKSYIHSNVEGFKSLVKFVLYKKPKKFIFASPFLSKHKLPKIQLFHIEDRSSPSYRKRWPPRNQRSFLR